MSQPASPLGILIISHGSPRAEANAGFTGLVGRVAARLDMENVLPTFFSIARPNIPDRVAELAARGVRRVLLMPYFLYTGQHVTADIPEILSACRRQYPQLEFELLPTLENDPAVEDVVTERLLPYAELHTDLPTAGPAIERRSFAIIDRQLAGHVVGDAHAQQILRRIVHATADLSFARSLRVHPQAVERGRAALATGRPVICDVRMVQAGLTKIAGEVLCALDQPGLAELAERQGCTRSAAGMQLLAARIEGAIVAIGNAPTALWKVLELAHSGQARPALVVGLPVGFVGARESKVALAESDLCYITNLSPRGGSPVAAAAVNALAAMQKEEQR